jgi:hypothetical protein
LTIDLDEATITSKITAVNLTVAMDISVVLMDSSSADEPQVRTCHEPTTRVINPPLWLDVDLGCYVKDSHYRFPRGFAAAVEERQHRTQAWGSTAALGGRSPKLFQSAVATTQRRVAKDDQIEHAEISCRCEQCFGAGRDPETMNCAGGHETRVPAYQEAFALGIAFTDWHSDEDGVRDRLWKPPTA